MKYEWVNTETGEFVTVERKIADSKVAPDDSGKWKRVYSLSIGRVEGAGGSSSGYVSTRKQFDGKG